MRKVDLHQKLLLCTVMVSCLFVWACGERPMGQKEELAIQLVKGHIVGEAEYGGSDGFSLGSNIEKRRADAGRAGNPWTVGPWTAGLLSQSDRINDELSQYFNIFESPGGRWVRFTYSDKEGDHEAIWETHIYKKTVVATNDLAKELMQAPSQ